MRFFLLEPISRSCSIRRILIFPIWMEPAGISTPSCAGLLPRSGELKRAGCLGFDLGDRTKKRVSRSCVFLQGRELQTDAASVLRHSLRYTVAKGILPQPSFTCTPRLRQFFLRASAFSGHTQT